MAPALSPPVTHIRLDEHGIPWIEGTSYKVEMLIREHLDLGWSPAELVYQHYRAFSVAQAHAALAYYHDNTEAFSRLMAGSEEEEERLLKEAGAVPVDAERGARTPA